MLDEIVEKLLGSKMWCLSAYLRSGFYTFDSDMLGFSSGRYRLYITRLSRKSVGCYYKIDVYYTPYNPKNRIFRGRFNTYDELLKIIGGINIDLLDTNRIYK